MERVYSYKPGARMGLEEQGIKTLWSIYFLIQEIPGGLVMKQ